MIAKTELARSRLSVALTVVALAACRCSGTSAPPPTEYPPVPPVTPVPPPLVPAAPHELPLVVYTDLESAPAGAYVTLWGRDFGAAQGDSTVLLGSTPVARVVRWSDARIEIKLPSAATSGALVVRTPAGQSPGVPLRIHQGRLWFVAPTGSDAAAGTEDAPLRTPHKVSDSLAPGDVAYVRAGQYAELDDFDASWTTMSLQAGTAEQPIAILGYPGEEATIGDNTLLRAFSFLREAPLEHITIGKLRLRAACMALPLEHASHVRIVGNEIFGARGHCDDGTISTGDSSHIEIIGNYIHDNGGIKLKHAIYLPGFGENRDIEIAYNRIEQQHGGRAIQLYGHQSDDVIRQIKIHDNEISEIDRDAILLGNTDEGRLLIQDVLIYNNIIHRAGRCEGFAVRVDNPTADGIRIIHNTLVYNGLGDTRCDEGIGTPLAQIGVQQARSVAIQNNILVSQRRSRLVQATSQTAEVLCVSNLYFGPGPRCADDNRSVTRDPQFVAGASRNFRLRPASPAIDTGMHVLDVPDHDGVMRPQGPEPDLGAFEYAPAP